jgi:hypothetical protein
MGFLGFLGYSIEVCLELRLLSCQCILLPSLLPPFELKSAVEVLFPLFSEDASSLNLEVLASFAERNELQCELIADAVVNSKVVNYSLDNRLLSLTRVVLRKNSINLAFFNPEGTGISVTTFSSNYFSDKASCGV